mgnify:CR=1 FL=1
MKGGLKRAPSGSLVDPGSLCTALYPDRVQRELVKTERLRRAALFLGGDERPSWEQARADERLHDESLHISIIYTASSTHHLEYSYKLYISNRVVLKCNRIYTSIRPREDARVVERLETLGA